MVDQKKTRRGRPSKKSKFEHVVTPRSSILGDEKKLVSDTNLLNATHQKHQLEDSSVPSLASSILRTDEKTNRCAFRKLREVEAAIFEVKPSDPPFWFAIGGEGRGVKIWRFLIT